MTSDDEMGPAKDRQSIESVVTGFIVNLAREGLIDLRGKTQGEIADELIRIADSYEWVPVVDHTPDILEQARLFRKAKLDPFACLFYALWIEHTLNSFVASFARRKGITNKEIETIIRDTSYRSKCTWLLHLLGGKPFSTSHVNIIARVMESRNSFVHYKWKPESEQATEELEMVLSKVEKTVNYVRRYEIRHLIGLSRQKIGQIAKVA